jgi:hypothetical protein
MNGRGAVELVVASVVIQLSDELLNTGVIKAPLLTEDQFSGLVFMAFVTTLMAPVSLKWAVGKSCSSTENAEFCQKWDRST